MPRDTDKICTEDDLRKIDTVNKLINSLASADSDEKLQEVNANVEEYLKSHNKSPPKSPTGINRTVINKDAYKNDGVPNEHTAQSKEAFMAAVEADAKERAERRKKNRARADKKKDIANDYFKSGDMTKAIDIYTEAIDICRDYAALYTNRALAFMRTGEPEKAFNDCEWALKIEEDNVKAMIQRGRALLAMGKPDEAEENFNNVLRIDSSKTKLVSGYLDEVKQYRVAKQRENDALQRFDNADSSRNKGMLETLCKLANQNQPLIYYAGGLRFMASVLTEIEPAGDTSNTCNNDRVMFRLKGGFKLLTADHKVIGSVLAREISQLSEEEQNLLLSVFDLCTVVAKDDTENQKTALLNDNLVARLVEVLSIVIKSDSQQSKICLSLRNSAVSFLYECAKYETGRIALVDTIKPSVLLPLILRYIREVQEKSDGMKAATMLENLAQCRKFQAAFNGKLDSNTMQNLEAMLTQGGKGPSTFSALPICIEFLVFMCEDAKIKETLAKRSSMLQACTKTFERHAPMHSDADHQLLLISLIRLILTLSTVRNNSFEPIASRLLEASTRILTELHEGKLREILLPLVAAIFKYLTKEQIFNWCEPGVASTSSHPASPPITPTTPTSFSRQTVSCCVQLLLAIVEVDNHTQLGNALRILGSCVTIHDNTRFLVGDDASIVRRLHKLIRPYKGFNECLAGNAAMLMLSCVGDTRMAEYLTSSSIIQDLLSLCQEANISDTRRNAAILASKLANANNRHREEIGRLQGWSILTKFNEWTPGAKR